MEERGRERRKIVEIKKEEKEKKKHRKKKGKREKILVQDQTSREKKAK